MSFSRLSISTALTLARQAVVCVKSSRSRLYMVRTFRGQRAIVTPTMPRADARRYQREHRIVHALEKLGIPADIAAGVGARARYSDQWWEQVVGEFVERQLLVPAKAATRGRVDGRNRFTA